MITETTDEVHGVGGRDCVDATAITVVDVETIGLLHLLEALPNELLADIGQLTDLGERSRDFVGLASTVDGCCNDGIRLLSTENLVLFDLLEHVLCRLRDGAREMNNIAFALDVFKGVKDDTILRSPRATHGSLQIPSSACATVAETDARVELVGEAIHEGAIGLADTRGVVAFFIGKCTPLRSSIDDLVAYDHATIATDEVSARKLLDEVWRIVSALWTDETHTKIGNEVILGLLLSFGRGRVARGLVVSCQGERLCIGINRLSTVFGCRRAVAIDSDMRRAAKRAAILLNSNKMEGECEFEVSFPLDTPPLPLSCADLHGLPCQQHRHNLHKGTKSQGKIAKERDTKERC